jgi:hypothetical protein
MSTTLTAKGQVSIPKPAAKHAPSPTALKPPVAGPTCPGKPKTEWPCCAAEHEVQRDILVDTNDLVGPLSWQLEQLPLTQQFDLSVELARRHGLGTPNRHSSCELAQQPELPHGHEACDCSKVGI